ncbi:MAG: hypothetical protein A2X86_00970 [Bdellovibrionales bacterium GWA2_49_15]|nr:MAG: hypothetical protein A2X86_00970 [Bdellovibrionales bacterium GWA2_49_15]
MLRYLFLFSFSLLAIPSHSETIVVQADRVPVEEMMNKVRADRIITAEDISGKGYHFLHQLLSEEAGIHVVQSGPQGGQTSLFLHGLKSEHVLVLIDGVPMNDPSSPGRSYDFSHLSLLNVERIEIVKGPDSVHYGSDALAGVIKIWTKSGEKAWHSALRGEGGSFTTSGVQADTRGPVGQSFLLNLAAEQYNTGGFSAASSQYPGNEEDDGLTRQSAQIKIEGRPEGFAHLTMGGKWEKTKTELDQGGGAYQDDLDYSLRQQNRSCFLAIDKTVNDFLAPTFKMQGAFHQKIANNPGTLFEHYEGHNRLVSLQNTSLLGEESKLSAGIEGARESMEIRGTMPEKTADSQGVFVSMNQRWGRSDLLLGARNDHHEIFGDFQSYSIRPSYTFDLLPLGLSAGWSSGFKAPTLYQLYSTYGRSTLGPERARTLQLKALLTLAAWEMEAQVFQTKVEDLIDFDFVSSKYSNQGALSAKGGELALRGPLSSFWAGEVSYSYTQSYDQLRQKALRRPTHQAEVQVSYKADPWSGRLSGHFVGRREDIHSTNFTRITMPSYFLLNLFTSYNVKKNLKGDLRVDNVLDKQYEEVHGLGTAGRSYFAGLSYDFE